MYQKVLVPLDGSKLAECVVEHVESIATGCQVPTVVLMQVVEPIGLRGYLPLGMAEDTYRDAKETAEIKAKSYLNEMADRLKAEGIAVETDIADGLPANEILSYAEEKVVSQSLIPVLVVTPPGCRISR